MTELHAVLDIKNKEERLVELETILKQPNRNLEYKLSGETPLHYASFFGRTECVKRLLQEGAQADAVSEKDGSTPLHIACTYGKTDVVRALLDSKKCDTIKKTRDGFTPLHLSVLCSKKDCVDLLVNDKVKLEINDTQDENPLHLSIRRGEIEIIKSLVKIAEKNITDKKGRSYLHYATMFEKEEIIQFFLETKFADDVNVKDNEGWTPLHMAVLLKNQSIIKLLTSNGGDMKLSNNKGYTPQQFSQYEQLMEKHGEFVKKLNDN